MINIANKQLSVTLVLVNPDRYRKRENRSDKGLEPRKNLYNIERESLYNLLQYRA